MNLCTLTFNFVSLHLVRLQNSYYLNAARFDLPRCVSLALYSTPTLAFTCLGSFVCPLPNNDYLNSVIYIIAKYLQYGVERRGGKFACYGTCQDYVVLVYIACQWILTRTPILQISCISTREARHIQAIDNLQITLVSCIYPQDCFPTSYPWTRVLYDCNPLPLAHYNEYSYRLHYGIVDLFGTTVSMPLP